MARQKVLLTPAHWWDNDMLKQKSPVGSKSFSHPFVEVLYLNLGYPRHPCATESTSHSCQAVTCTELSLYVLQTWITPQAGPLVLLSTSFLWHLTLSRDANDCLNVSPTLHHHFLEGITISFQPCVHTFTHLSDTNWHWCCWLRYLSHLTLLLPLKSRWAAKAE